MVKTVLFKRLILRALNGHGRGLSSACDIRTPDFLTLSMKAKLVDSMPSGHWIYEIKFDGYRALGMRGAVKRGSYLGTKRIWAAGFQK